MSELLFNPSAAPQQTAGTSRRLLFLALWVLLLAVVQGVGYWGASYDDSFITYRYALNLADHGCLCYNQGERVMGTTAPGYAVFLGILALGAGASGVGPPELGTLVSLVSLAGLVGFVYFCAPRLGLSSWVAFAYAPLAFGFRWNFELFGAEAFPVVSLVAWSALVTLGMGRLSTGGLLVGAAAVFRTDAVLAIAVVGGFSLLRERTLPWRFVAAACLPLMVVQFGLWMYFGAVVPETLAAKQLEGAPNLPYTLDQWSWLGRSIGDGYPDVVLAVLAVLGGLIALAQRSTIALALTLWLLGHELAYRVLDVPFAPWYHLGLVNAGLIGAAVAAVHHQRIGRALPVSLPGAGRIASTVVLGSWLLVAGLIGQTAVEVWGRAPDPRYDIYKRVGLFLKESPPGHAAALEIGVLGYFSEKPIVDLLALVSPEALPGKLAGDVTLTLDATRPEYVIEVGLFQDQYGIQKWSPLEVEYGPTAVFQDPGSGRGEITVFRKGPDS